MGMSSSKSALVQVLCLLTIFLISGCDKQDIFNKFSSPEDQKVARGYFDDLSARNLDAIENDVDPSLKGPGLRPTLQKMTELMPAEEPTSVKVVGAHLFKSAA